MGLRDAIREAVQVVLFNQLGPWVTSNFQSEFSVHFFGANLELRHIVLDVGKLNDAAMSSSPLILLQAGLDSLDVHISSLHTRAATLVLRGLHLVLRPRLPEDLWWEASKRKSEQQAREAAMAGLDPQGAASHCATEQLAESASTKTFLTTFLASIALSAFRFELHHCSAEVVIDARTGACEAFSVSLERLVFEEGFIHGMSVRRSLIGAALAATARVWSATDELSRKCCQIEGKGMRVNLRKSLPGNSKAAKWGPESRRSPPASHEYQSQPKASKSNATARSAFPFEDSDSADFSEDILQLQTVFIMLDFQEVLLKRVQVEIPTASVGVDARELVSLLIFLSHLSSPDSTSSGQGSSSRELPERRTASDLWQLGFKKAIANSSKRQLRKALLNSVLRHRYSALYQAWLLQTGWDQDWNVVQAGVRKYRSNKHSLKKLQNHIKELEEGLPLEAVALARRVARCSAAKALRDQRQCRRKILEGANTGLWSSTTEVFSYLIFISYVFAGALKALLCHLRVFIWLEALWRLICTLSVKVVGSGDFGKMVGCPVPAKDGIPSSLRSACKCDRLGHEDCVSKTWEVACEVHIGKSSLTFACAESDQLSKGGLLTGSADTAVPAPAMMPAVRVVLEQLSLSYGSDMHVDGASIACGVLRGELLYVVPERLPARPYEARQALNLDENFVHSGCGRAMTPSCIQFLSSTPISAGDKLNLHEHESLAKDGVFAGVFASIQGKHKLWREKEVDKWGKRDWGSLSVQGAKLPGCSAAEFLSPGHPNFEALRPFLVAEFEIVKSGKWTGGASGGLICCMLDIGRLECLVRPCFPSRINPLVAQLLQALSLCRSLTRDEGGKGKRGIQSEPEVIPTAHEAWDSCITKCLIMLRKQMVTYVPSTSFQCSFVVECPQLRLSALAAEFGHDASGTQCGESAAFDGSREISLLVDFGHLELVSAPASLRESAIWQERQMGDFGSLGRWWTQTIESKHWLEMPALPGLVDLTMKAYSQRETAGNNVFVSVQQIVIVLDTGEQGQAGLTVAGPLCADLKLSLCRDEFGSLFSTTTCTACGIRGEISGLTIKAYVCELLVIFQLLRTFQGALETLSMISGGKGGCPGEVLPEEPALLSEELAATDTGISNTQHRPRRNDVVSNQESNKSAFAVSVHLHVKALDLWLGIERWDEGCENTKRHKGRLTSKEGPCMPVGMEDTLNAWLRNMELSKTGNHGYVCAEGVQSSFFLGDGCQASVSASLNQLLLLTMDFSRAREVVDFEPEKLCRSSMAVQSRLRCSGAVSSELELDKSSLLLLGPAIAPSDYHVYDAGNVTEHNLNPINPFTCRVKAINDVTGSKSAGRNFVIRGEVEQIHVGKGMSALFTEAVNQVASGASTLFLEVVLSPDFQNISSKMKGGLLFLETSTLVSLLRFSASYQELSSYVLTSFHGPGNLKSNMKHGRGTSMMTQRSPSMSSTSSQKWTVRRPRRVSSAPLLIQTCTDSADNGRSKWEGFFLLQVEGFSLVLSKSEASEVMGGLLFELDLLLNFEFSSRTRSIMVDLSRFMIFGVQAPSLGYVNGDSKVVRAPRFGSIHTSSGSSSTTEGSSCEINLEGFPLSVSLEAAGGTYMDYEQAFAASSESVTPDASTCILEQLRISCLVESIVVDTSMNDDKKWSSAWRGSCSIAGLDIAITAPEIKLMQSLVSSLSEFSSKAKGDEFDMLPAAVAETFCGQTSYLNHDLQNGTIVALKDEQEHMYLAVEEIPSREGQYRLVSVMHYSLAGQKALFKVRYHDVNQKNKWFSLVSLYAKSRDGEPLRVHCCPGSGLAEISSTNDGSWESWRCVPYETTKDHEHNDFDHYSYDFREMVLLVNQKSNGYLAIVDCIPMIVAKPGNPYKVKKVYSVEENGSSNLNGAELLTMAGSHQRETDPEERAVTLTDIPQITFEVESIVATILHEAGGGTHLLPLVRCRMEKVHALAQLGAHKTRFISGCSLFLEYFEAQTNLWAGITSPAEVSTFYRKRTSQTGSAASAPQKIPTTIYFRFRKVDITVSEPSLDACLFLIGVLELAGPYAIRHSPVAANQCKVDNQLGVDLLCRFKQSRARISARDSGSFFIRHTLSRRDVTSGNVASAVDLYLEKAGAAASSPIHVSLIEPAVMALRIRLDIGEGRTAPGPIIVVDVSRHCEDGVILTVSSMVRIRNASGRVLELRCRRPNQVEGAAVVVLEDGDVIDDATGSFDALAMDGEYRKALSSFTVGNFLLSIRPAYMPLGEQEYSSPVSYQWSDDVKGAKAESVSGLFEKLHYNLRKSLKGLGAESTFQSSFGTVFCPQIVSPNESGTSAKGRGLYFLVRTTLRQIPLALPHVDSKQQSKKAVWHEQQELLLLPTIRLCNLLTSDVTIRLYISKKGKGKMEDAKSHAPAAEESIASGGRTCLHVALNNLFLIVKHDDLGLTSKPVAVNAETKASKELLQMYNGADVRDVEIPADFGDGIHTATLKVFRGADGVINVSIFTKYTLQNDSDVSLLHCAVRNSKWGVRKSKDQSIQCPSDTDISELQPHTKASWLNRSNKLLITRQETDADVAVVDLESLSGAMEINLGIQKSETSEDHVQLGVNMQLPPAAEANPTNVIQLLPRYVIVNESTKELCVCQDGFQGDTGGFLTLDAGQRTAVHAQVLQGKRERSHSREIKDVGTDFLLSIRLRPRENSWNWSGPLCLASLGTFCSRIRRSTGGFPSVEKGSPCLHNEKAFWFASTNCQEESASLVMHIRSQSSGATPYRIENVLHSKTILYQQKGLSESDALGPGASAPYAWDDLSLLHKLVVTVTGTQLCREINLDKVRSWKLFYASRKKKRFALQLPFQDQLDDGYDDDDYDGFSGLGELDIGFEVYAEGTTRILRISEQIDNAETQWNLKKSVPRLELQLKVPMLGLCLVEPEKQASNVHTVLNWGGSYLPIICPRMTGLVLEMGVASHSTICQLKIKRFDIDVKWQGAPFAALLRASGRDRFRNHTVLHFAAILSNKSSSPLHVRYASFLFQAMDLNLDEDTLMKLAPFYRRSLADASTPSRQIYFDRLEIHPIKIVASFLPGNPRADYSSAQEALRGLLHSVIKIPSVRGKTVELNGVLLSHALLTYKQLALKCAQHYSWYAMRAIYMARGSELLPPAFASLFDDTAAASLDVFFDPSSGSIDFQGLTLGMFSLLSHGLLRQGQGGTRRYLGDLEKTMKSAGSNLLFAVVTEISDNVLKGAESNGVDGMVTGFRRGILNVAMEPALLRSAVVKGGSTRQIKLDRSVGMDEVYVEGYLQGMLDARFKQDYMRVKVVDDQVILKNLPPNTELIEDIIGTVRGFLVGEGFVTEGSQVSGFRSMSRLHEGNERRLGPALYALSEQLLVIIAVRALKNQARKVIHMQIGERKREGPAEGCSTTRRSKDDVSDSSRVSEARHTDSAIQDQVGRNLPKTMSKFVLSTAIAYIDGRLCRHLPNSFLRRIVSGFLLSFIE